MVNVRLVAGGCGRDTYEVTGDVGNYTDEELMNKCDHRNFGGYVRGRSAESAMVVVYTD